MIRRCFFRVLILTCLGIISWLHLSAPLMAQEPDVLPGTQRLTLEGDIASHLVSGVDRFLLREVETSAERRLARWKPDTSSLEAYQRWLEPRRNRLAHILGVRDPRASVPALEYQATTREPALLARGPQYEVHLVRWPAFGDVHGEGLLLVPVNREPLANVVAIPDADQTPEQLAGLQAGLPPDSQVARRLAESGCRVVVPALLSRKLEPRNGRAVLTHREFIYRSAYELGRHILGYEIQKVLAVVDWFTTESQLRANNAAKASPRIGLVGYGEGGLIALYAAALDPRIQSVCVGGCFGDRRDVWRQPVDRNVFGLLEDFGDAEVAAMILPRQIVVEACKAPEVTLPGSGGAPGRLITPPLSEVEAECARARRLAGPFARTRKPDGSEQDNLIVVGQPDLSFNASAQALTAFLQPFGVLDRVEELPKLLRSLPDAEARQRRQLHELDRHNQWLLSESPYVRQQFIKPLWEAAKSLESYEKEAERYRRIFAEEVIGRFDYPLLPANPRTRKLFDEPKWTGYEVVLDVYPDVIAYGILLLPKRMKGDEKRPVVVCQHGLEGRPVETITGDHPAYHDFAAKLAERGFITFSPQNLYIFGDRFRTLQRKANPIQKTLFSVIVPQHQQIVNWLKTLPNVDGERIGFYGLSYGGKSAMRIPPLVKEYCLSICSADFNEWVWKNASSRSPYSYVFTGEYEIFEFDLGSTFNYAEMAALIAPRPFMVERGHFDGVAPDETVAYEFAKVRHLYQARLGLGDRVAIEWFVGPHTIHGKGTFEFLHRHLRWPEPR
ncbi:MAG: dienelactone hydrolase family protein [Gemmatales bacterium]|nr:dienelactone hydrolase family protein [Gemmatales bacterium]MDW8386602.1 dienelactone hydrolase family protein [Gemmatales bacterium]